MQSGLRFQPHQADSLGHRNQTFPAQGSRQRCDQHRHDTTGLHFAGIDLLPKVLHRLQGAGTTTVATTVATNHNLDAIKAADWVVGMGPEGGAGGGTVVTTSMPEQVAANLAGCTGQRVRPYLSAII